VNVPRRQISARDYKNTGSGNSPSVFDTYRQFLYGLGAGLAVASIVHLAHLRARKDQPPDEPVAQAKKAADDTPVAEESVAQYDFYDMLPKFEVVVPEKERDVTNDGPTVSVARPGMYVLQAGSYRNLPDAERLRDKLLKQGIKSAIQRVQVDADVWHRVRMGPFTDLKQLNSTRSSLRAADVDAIVIRLPD
jgi:cell division protein FtsN